MFDLIILGSGPAGLTASIYAARAGLRFTVIEKEYMGTGQIAYAERVDNYPGFYGLDGYTLGEKFREHAEALGTKFIEGKVTALANADGVWSITFSDGCTTQTKAVIYALGASPRKLGIPGEAELTGRGVSYCALCDGAFFAGKAVAVIGGGDTALSDALYLSKSAEKVYLVHRRDTFRANKALTDKVLAVPNIQPVY
ncbi:MAG: FAD-dependent oxidoreductase, partial [Ruminococcus sp.]|nr:FAD-dependent oxidoreductase [Ruminococcus sp.]